MARRLGERMTSNQIERLNAERADQMPMPADAGLAMKAELRRTVQIGGWRRQKKINVLLTMAG
jgi:hypothetical protein